MGMTFPEQYQAQLIETIRSLDMGQIHRAIEVLAEARDQGRRIFTCGNGGSASAASHFATDMVKGASFGREKRSYA